MHSEKERRKREREKEIEDKMSNYKKKIEQI